MTSLRRAEDQAFFGSLRTGGFAVRHMDLGLEDAHLRLNLGRDTHALYDTPIKACSVDNIAAAMERHVAKVHFSLFPAGIGSHVDHKTLHEVGRRLKRKGYPVSFYLDQPYTLLNPGIHTDATAWSAVNSSRVRRIKIEAATAYASQPASKRLVTAMSVLPKDTVVEAIVSEVA